jgi:hypothetical protein
MRTSLTARPRRPRRPAAPRSVRSRALRRRSPRDAAAASRLAEPPLALGQPHHRPAFWDHPHFQDRVVALWETIADHHRDNPWVAGDNLTALADSFALAHCDVRTSLVDQLRTG